MAATVSVTIASGTTTSYLPLSTTWTSAGTDCASAIYRPIDQSFFAWDPAYVDNINKDFSTCWPPQATSWWFQTKNSVSTTILGPRFVCPGAYYGVLTSTFNAETTQTFCCPSGYRFYHEIDDLRTAVLPTQCTSTVTAGETLKWEGLSAISSLSSWTWGPSSSTVQSGTVTIYGVPINGLNVATSSDTSTVSQAPAKADTISITALASSTSKTAAASTSSSRIEPSGSNSSFAGVTVGIIIGAVMGVLLLGVAGFFLFSWIKRNPVHKERNPREIHQAATQRLALEEAVNRANSVAYRMPGPPAEIGTSLHFEAAELSVDVNDGPGRGLRRKI